MSRSTQTTNPSTDTVFKTYLFKNSYKWYRVSSPSANLKPHIKVKRVFPGHLFALKTNKSQLRVADRRFLNPKNRIISSTNFNAQFPLFINNIFYTIILDMFRALTCPSSGGQIVFSQHLVSSLSANGCTVHRLRADSVRLQRAKIPDAVRIQFVLRKMGMLVLETCRG